MRKTEPQAGRFLTSHWNGWRMYKSTSDPCLFILQIICILQICYRGVVNNRPPPFKRRGYFSGKSGIWKILVAVIFSEKSLQKSATGYFHSKIISIFFACGAFLHSFSHLRCVLRLLPPRKNPKIFRLRRKTNHSDVITYLVFSPPVDKKVPVIFLEFPNPQNFCYRLFSVLNQPKAGFRGYGGGGGLFTTPR